MGMKDSITFKQLMVNLKIKGLKQIVIASKELSMLDYQNFIKNFRLVSKMTRNQQENFHKLAIDIEQDLTYLGCLGIKNTIPEEVKKLTRNLLAAEIKVSMLTGDILENSIMAAKELEISNADFGDASSYYSMRFNSEEEGMVQMRRILEYLYENLKIASVYDAQAKIKRQRRERRNFSSSTGRRRSFFSGTEKGSHNSKKDKEKENVKKESSELRRKMHKTVLLSGTSVSIIKSSDTLTNHFCFILHFCNNIIGYSLNGSNKSFVVKCLKLISNGMVMSVGDGFNDMSMLREANVGVQIAHQDVPLIFGDIVISEMKILNYLLFVKGKQIYTNYISFCLVLIAILGSTSGLAFTLNSNILFSGRFFQPWSVMVMYSWLVSAIIISTTSNQSFTREVLEKNPEFYLERRVLNKNFLTLCSGCLLISIMDSLITSMTTNYMIKMIPNPSGYILEKNALALHVTISIIIMSVFKVYMLFVRLGAKFWISNMIFIVLTAVFLFVMNTADQSVTNRIPISELMSNPMTFYAFLSSVGVNCFIIYVLFYWMSKMFIYPFYYSSVQQLNLGNYEYFSGNRETSNQLNPTHFIPKEKRKNLAACIRAIFKNNADMEDYLKKIMTLDSSSFNFGLERITCQIKDNAENKRYQIYKRNWENDAFKKYIFYHCVALLAEYILILIGTKSSNNFFDYSIPYRILLFLIPLTSSFFESQKRKVEIYLKLVTVFSLLVHIVIEFFLGGQPYVTWNIALTRLYQGPAMIEFVFGSCIIAVNLFCQVVQLFFYESFNGFVFSALFKVNIAIQFVLISGVSLLFKQKVRILLFSYLISLD